MSLVHSVNLPVPCQLSSSHRAAPSPLILLHHLVGNSGHNNTARNSQLAGNIHGNNNGWITTAGQQQRPHNNKTSVSIDCARRPTAAADMRATAGAVSSSSQNHGSTTYGSRSNPAYQTNTSLYQTGHRTTSRPNAYNKRGETRSTTSSATTGSSGGSSSRGGSMSNSQGSNNKHKTMGSSSSKTKGSRPVSAANAVASSMSSSKPAGGGGSSSSSKNRYMTAHQVPNKYDQLLMMNLSPKPQDAHVQDALKQLQTPSRDIFGSAEISTPAGGQAASAMQTSGGADDLARTITPPVPHHEHGNHVPPASRADFHINGCSPVSDANSGSPRTVPTTPPAGMSTPEAGSKGLSGQSRGEYKRSGVTRSITDKIRIDILEKIRKKVSKNKKRYQFDGDISGRTFDLSYIEDRIIAMGFPSSGIESYYRNNIDEIELNLNRRHGKRYRVYNLCVEKGKKDGYPHTRFNGNQKPFGFYDHCPPTFLMILEFCKDAYDYLEAHQENVVVVHCKAGKGRTGSMICCLLIYISYRIEQEEEERMCSPGAGSCALDQSQHSTLSGVSSILATHQPQTAPSGIPYPSNSKVRIREVLSAEAAMEYYAQRRTHDNKGVTIPSQKRAVKYMELYFKHRLRYPEHRRAHMLRLTLKNLPKFYRDDLWFEIRQWDAYHEKYRQITNNKSPMQGPKWEDPVYRFIEPVEAKPSKRGWQSKLVMSGRNQPLPSVPQVQWVPLSGSTLDGMVKLDFFHPSYNGGEKPIFSATFDTFFHSLPQHMREEIHRTTPVQHSLVPSPSQGVEEKATAVKSPNPIAGEYLLREKEREQQAAVQRRQQAEELKCVATLKANELALTRSGQVRLLDAQGGVISNTASISSEMFAFDRPGTAPEGAAAVAPIFNNTPAASIPQFNDVTSTGQSLVTPVAVRGRAAPAFSNRDDHAVRVDEMLSCGQPLQEVTRRSGFTAGAMGGHEVPKTVHKSMCSKNDSHSQVGNMVPSNTVLPNHELSSSNQYNNISKQNPDQALPSSRLSPNDYNNQATPLTGHPGVGQHYAVAVPVARPQLVRLIKVKPTEDESGGVVEKLMVAQDDESMDVEVKPPPSKRNGESFAQSRSSAFGTPPKATKAFAPSGNMAVGGLSLSNSSTPNSAFSKPLSSKGNSPLCIQSSSVMRGVTRQDSCGVLTGSSYKDLIVYPADTGSAFTSSDAPSAAEEYYGRRAEPLEDIAGSRSVDILTGSARQLERLSQVEDYTKTTSTGNIRINNITSSTHLYNRLAAGTPATSNTNQIRPSSNRTHTTSTTSSSTANTVTANSTGSSATLGSSNSTNVSNRASVMGDAVRGTADRERKLSPICQTLGPPPAATIPEPMQLSQYNSTSSIQSKRPSSPNPDEPESVRLGAFGGETSVVPPSIYGELTLRTDEREPDHQRIPASCYNPMKSTERTFVFSRDELDGFAKDKELERRFQENFQVCLYCQDNMNDIQDEVTSSKFMVQSFEYDQIRSSHMRLEKCGQLPRTYLGPRHNRPGRAGNHAETSSSSSDF